MMKFLKEFSAELNKTISDNQVMELKLEGISGEIEKIRRASEKQEPLSEMHLMLIGIASTLENIIK